MASLPGERASGLMRRTAAQEQACCRDVSSPSSQGLAQRRCHLLEPDGENCSRPGLVCVCPCDLSCDTAQLALLPSDPSRSGLQSIPGTAPCPWSPRSTLPCTARRLSTPAVQAWWPVCAVCAPPGSAGLHERQSWARPLFLPTSSTSSFPASRPHGALKPPGHSRS